MAEEAARPAPSVVAARRQLVAAHGELKTGERYTVVYRLPQQQEDHYAVLDFLGEERGHPVFGGHLLAERVTIQWTWIKEIAAPAFPYTAWNRLLRWPPAQPVGK